MRVVAVFFLVIFLENPLGEAKLNDPDLLADEQDNKVTLIDVKQYLVQ